MNKKVDGKEKSFNSSVSLGKSNGEETGSHRKRNSKRDIRRSKEHKQRKKESKYWAKEDDSLLTHIPYKGIGENI